MASVKFISGTSAYVSSVVKSKGQFLYTTDLGLNNKIYADLDANTRIQIGGTNTVDTAMSSSSTNPIANSTVNTALSYKEGYTFVVDSQTKMDMWTGNVAGNDYSSVLIRGMYSTDGINLWNTFL